MSSESCLIIGAISYHSYFFTELVAYSDDEDDGGSFRVIEDRQSVTNGQSHDNGERAQARDTIAAKQSDMPFDDNDRASTSTPRAERHGLLYLLAPPPKLLPPESPGGSFLEDHEWGLGIEKSTEGVDEALAAKLAKFHKLKEEQGTHFNQSLNRNRSFRNPHIYSKLVQWVGVEETGSAYADMIKGGKKRADEVWASSEEARAELIKQGGKDVIGEHCFPNALVPFRCLTLLLH